MAMTNAERQAEWRRRRAAELKKLRAGNVAPGGDRIVEPEKAQEEGEDEPFTHADLAEWEKELDEREAQLDQFEEDLDERAMKIDELKVENNMLRIENARFRKVSACDGFLQELEPLIEWLELESKKKASDIQKSTIAHVAKKLRLLFDPEYRVSVEKKYGVRWII